MRLLVVTALCALAFGCATPQAVTDSSLSARRLLVLEGQFHELVAKKLTAPEDIERETRALESLRLQYLDALQRADVPRDRLLCLLRIAEMHLDLAARVRRVPYPKGMREEEKRAFDQSLSQDALPLEAVGRGVLTQAIDYAETNGVDGRFVQRARLYLALYAGESLTPDDIAFLRKELSAGTFVAPRTLLEAGRVGQRAARR